MRRHVHRRGLRAQLSTAFLASCVISMGAYRVAGIVYVPAITVAVVAALLLAVVITLKTRSQS